MTQKEILTYAAIGVCAKIENVKKAAMREDIREQKLAKLEVQRKEINAMLAEAIANQEAAE